MTIDKIKPAKRRLRQLTEYKPRFDYQQNPSEFYSLIEWYAKVMFPNFEEAMEIAKKVRKIARRIEKKYAGNEIDETSLAVLRGLLVAEDLDRLHKKMNRRQDQVFAFARFSHDLSDELECLNGDLNSSLRALRGLLKRCPD